MWLDFYILWGLLKAPHRVIVAVADADMHMDTEIKTMDFFFSLGTGMVG